MMQVVHIPTEHGNSIEI